MIEIVDHRKYVMDNQPIQQFLLDRLPGQNDKFFGTLDKALERFNSILLKLSQDPILAQEHNHKVIQCQNAIHDFYHYTCKLTNTENWFKKNLLQDPFTQDRNKKYSKDKKTFQSTR